MALSSDSDARSRCQNCGFEAGTPDEWDAVDTPTLGRLTRCPECGSTRVTVLSS